MSNLTQFYNNVIKAKKAVYAAENNFMSNGGRYMDHPKISQCKDDLIEALEIYSEMLFEYLVTEENKEV